MFTQNLRPDHYLLKHYCS